ncbi:MAG TPA: UDP-4-amino-4,6-dideoxy-N-acetyl-beta-L-altrosamine transaminase [Ramlibacter sp.]|uniref:UDP-4-amino-4, 6-dideoxy-N-acetyl-beta-L-altrosamine transaminase n=1 Tax=Ramlibacter sp. TaxID=1917967 RepID=UPI002ED0B455
MNPIPYGRQEITRDDVEAVTAVLQSDFLTQGPMVPAFEQALTRHTGARHALAVNSATSALHIACLALELGPGDRLWTSPVTFLASANCGLYCGAEVDFVDIDPDTYNLSPVALAHKLQRAAKEGKLPRIVVAVHLAGQSCDMKAIRELSRQYGFKVIEDASHAIGGKYEGRPVGDCRYSDIAVFSFHPVKIVTTAEGGAALTNSDELAARMALLRSHGMTRDPGQMERAPEGPWYYEQVALGFNYRMTDLQAALGVSQMQRLEAYVARRQAIAARYGRLLAGLPLRTPRLDENAYSAFHLYVVRLEVSRTRRSQRELFEFMRASGIGVNLHYIPIYRQPFYARMGFDRGAFAEAERYYAEAMSLPMFPLLRDEEIDFVAATLKEALG